LEFTILVDVLSSNIQLNKEKYREKNASFLYNIGSVEAFFYL
jgi:hypothetical protein